jgi:uncharacterized GH25 family protein
MPRSPATHARRPAWALALGLVALAALPAQAHDYWLEFQPSTPTPGGELSAALWLGEDFIPEAQTAIQAARAVSLQHITRFRDVDLMARARLGVAPLLRLGLAAPGGHLLALERGTTRVQLRARRFNRYLEQEGLHDALAERKLSGERWRRGTERYQRYLKAFVQVGDDLDTVSTRVLGHRLEVVPERDLATVKVGERLGVRVLFEGRPLAGAQVEAFARGAGARPAPGQARVTDATGRAEFTVDESGTWLMRTVHMQRCIGCDAIQWESFWAAYSFALG